MLWPKGLLVYPERFLVEAFGLSVFAHSLVQRAQVIKARRGVGMFRAQDLLPDPERFLVERFGFGVLAHSLVQVGQVIEAVRRVGMFVPSHVIRGSFLTLITTEVLERNRGSHWF